MKIYSQLESAQIQHISTRGSLPTFSVARDEGRLLYIEDEGVLVLGVDDTISPPSGGFIDVDSSIVVLETAETMSPGDFVNVYEAGGNMTARKATADGATGPYKADGFSLSTVATPGTDKVVVKTFGKNTSVSYTSAPSTPYNVNIYLSKTSGEATDDISAYTTGDIVQELGPVIGATSVIFTPQTSVTLT